MTFTLRAFSHNFIAFLVLFHLPGSSPALAAPLPFIVNTSEPVSVDVTGGTPRLQLDVGGVTRYAPYVSGSGTAALTFTYDTQAGDLDLDGIALSSPLQFNGGVIADLAGNALSPLTFALPATSGVRVDHPSLSMDFIGNDYILSGTYYNSLPSFLTAAGGSFARASVGTYFDSSGVLQTAASGTPRFDHDPVTHVAKGILIEEARTNSIRNSSMQGAAVGNPGTLPSAGWATPTTSNGLARSVTGTGTINGMPYIDVRYAGTTTAAGFTNIQFLAAGQAAAANAQTWTHSIYLSMPSGSLANVSNLRLRMATYNGALGYFNDRPPAGGPLEGVTSTISRYSVTSNMNDASIAFIVPYIQFTYNTGVAVDFTLRIAVPQLEQGAFPTSYIPTASTAVTRQADVLSIPTGSWFDPSIGTLNVAGSLPVSGISRNPSFAAIDDSAANMARTMFLFLADGATPRTRFEVYNTAGQIGVSNSSLYTAGTSAKMAFAYQVNNTRPSFDGSLGTLSTTNSIPSVNRLIIGDGRGGALNGHARNVKYYPVRVSDTQLQLLTQ